MWNVKNACDECDKLIRCSLEVMSHDNEQEAKDRCEMNRNNETKMNARIRKK